MKSIILTHNKQILRSYTKQSGRNWKDKNYLPIYENF